MRGVGDRAEIVVVVVMVGTPSSPSPPVPQPLRPSAFAFCYPKKGGLGRPAAVLALGVHLIPPHPVGRPARAEVGEGWRVARPALRNQACPLLLHLSFSKYRGPHPIPSWATPRAGQQPASLENPLQDQLRRGRGSCARAHGGGMGRRFLGSPRSPLGISEAQRLLGSLHLLGV